MTITFDFDNTIAFSYMDLTSKEPKFIFQGYNQQIIQKIQGLIEKGEDIHIVTSRIEKKEDRFPKDRISYHLKELKLDWYFTPDRVHYTNARPKTSVLKALGCVLHHDDDISEHITLRKAGIAVESPLESLKDSSIVSKAIIYDNDNKILMLKRSDKGKKWDIPGGHIKIIEEYRGTRGFTDGLVREIGEETGLLLTNHSYLGTTHFHWRDKTHTIQLYLGRMFESEPKVDLEVQKYMENTDYKWVSEEKLPDYLSNSTVVAQKAVEMIRINKICYNTEDARRAYSENCAIERRIRMLDNE